MVTFYDALKIEYGNCPPDCTLCEEACAKEKGAGRRDTGRVKATHLSEFHGALTCIQCGEPDCLGVCPTGAITKSQADGVVRINEDKCLGCGLCTLVCPYGGVYFDQDNAKAFKCDLCDGDPKCVPACPYDVLTFVKTRPTLNYLRHEDILPLGAQVCQGCGAELAIRTAMKIIGKDAVYFFCAGCAAIIVGMSYAPNHFCLMTNVAATMSGVKRYYHKMGRDVKVVAYCGDGATADVGFQNISGAAERGENLIYICYDNEAYMNTGIQRSGTTPEHTWTFTTPVGPERRGKEHPTKYMPLIMALHGIPYVATAAVSHLEDYAAKVAKAAEVKDGMAYIHLFSPCPTGWRAPIDMSIEISRMAVETNCFPLWEMERGKYSLTHEVKRPRPIEEYTKLMGRFSHLTKEELEDFQRTVNDRFDLIKKLTAR